jgi:hypothetical protein
MNMNNAPNGNAVKADRLARERAAAEPARLRDQIVYRMENLAEALARKAKELKTIAPEALREFDVNSCGEVQGRGLDIDILCGRFVEAVKARNLADYLLGNLPQ